MTLIHAALALKEFQPKPDLSQYNNEMVKAGDQWAIELALEPGFAANGRDEQAHLKEHGTPLQIAQPGCGFRRDLRDHEPLSRKLLRMVWIAFSGELTS